MARGGGVTPHTAKPQERDQVLNVMEARWTPETA